MFFRPCAALVVRGMSRASSARQTLALRNHQFPSRTPTGEAAWERRHMARDSSDRMVPGSEKRNPPRRVV